MIIFMKMILNNTESEFILRICLTGKRVQKPFFNCYNFSYSTEFQNIVSQSYWKFSYIRALFYTICLCYKCVNLYSINNRLLLSQKMVCALFAANFFFHLFSFVLLNPKAQYIMFSKSEFIIQLLSKFWLTKFLNTPEGLHNNNFWENGHLLINTYIIYCFVLFFE
jgi:hypothetical protein